MAITCPAPALRSLAQVVTNNVIYSQTNIVASVVNHHNGTFTLNLIGTPGAQYYVVASTNINAHMANWTAVVGSTNTASSPSGTWSLRGEQCRPGLLPPGRG